MVHLERLPKPQILLKKEEEWTTKFVNSEKSRPDSSKYGHKQIREDLNSISFGKCFYCEKKINHERQEIDHFVEVSAKEGRNLAFDWNNLFLACDNCNRKINHETIPVTDVLDPFKNSDREIMNHLDFDREQIIARNNSKLGLLTIKKYRLNSSGLDYYRLRQLDYFNKILHQIRDNQIADNGRKTNQIELETLRRFAQKDHAFSFMFRCLLEKKGLL